MIQIYTDGSFKNNTIAWAFVVVDRDEVIHTANGIIKTPKPDLLKTRNIAGEMKAVMRAVAWAIQQGHKRIHLYHDYTGLAEWVLGNWRAKNYYTQQYVKWMKRANIKIHFNHVRGHSGDTYNELADTLAKEALDDA